MTEMFKSIISELDKDDFGKRLLFVIPETAGDVLICSGLLQSIKELYPELNLYFATKSQYFDIVINNPYIHKIINYCPDMDKLLYMEGIYDWPGLFEIAFLPYIQTQRVFTYQHNQYNRFAFDLFSDELKARRNIMRLTK